MFLYQLRLSKVKRYRIKILRQFHSFVLHWIGQITKSPFVDRSLRKTLMAEDFETNWRVEEKAALVKRCVEELKMF